MKPIRFSAHALGYVDQRGFELAEVIEAIRTRPWRIAPRNRLECQKDFPFGKTWNGTIYSSKRVRPIFAESSTEIVVVTVYTYFF